MLFGEHFAWSRDIKKGSICLLINLKQLLECFHGRAEIKASYWCFFECYYWTFDYTAIGPLFARAYMLRWSHFWFQEVHTCQFWYCTHLFLYHSDNAFFFCILDFKLAWTSEHNTLSTLSILMHREKYVKALSHGATSFMGLCAEKFYPQRHCHMMKIVTRYKTTYKESENRKFDCQWTLVSFFSNLELDLVRSNLNCRVLGTSIDAIFVSNDHSLYANTCM